MFSTRKLAIASINQIKFLTFGLKIFSQKLSKNAKFINLIKIAQNEKNILQITLAKNQTQHLKQS